ncbi:MAG: complex I NDUFA9 subunit family protein [Alphaproteobacteria bacterium]|nr:complex I NDUFA9 subunit family protein [Alphaproteobacteria bacterium]
MSNELIVVFGGSGFVGRHVVKQLARKGYRVRVPMRRPHLGQELRVLGDVGQIHLMQANVRFPDSIAAALEGADGVVNLVGVLYEKGRQDFQSMHVGAAEAIAGAAKAAGITKVVQVSAIGADARGKAKYARSKAAGEKAVRDAVPGAVVLRPSIVFGPEDNFFNRFADMAKFSPLLPLIGAGKTKFQPVHVQDVADAVVAALSRTDVQGRTYELGGPKVYSFRQLLDFVQTTINRKRGYLWLPIFLARPLGMLASIGSKILPIAPPFTGDQVEMLKTDNVVGKSGEKGIGTIADLGVAPLETIESIVPSYLWRFRPYGQF